MKFVDFCLELGICFVGLVCSDILLSSMLSRFIKDWTDISLYILFIYEIFIKAK